ncbi:MAG: diiron oxygenase [Actinomycetota bacterium]|nr:diiron oxygenase [Actinomycetota bacterium]
MTTTEAAVPARTAARSASPRDRAATSERVDRLNTASLRRIVEPDTEVAGSIGPGRVIPAELSIAAGLDLELTEEQLVRLSREELASIVIAGIRFEALLMSGFASEIAFAGELTDPRVTYMLHEIGEETRHSRLFVRLVDQLAPTAVNPIDVGVRHWIFRRVARALVRRPVVLCVLVLAGEEIPDLLQKKMVDHAETDPFVREVNRYHRMEEARHLAYARMVLPELWQQASALDRLLVRRLVPLVAQTMFDGIVHPGVFATVGLPAFATWRRAIRTPARVALRREALRPVLGALLDGGVLRPGRIPVGWRRLCGVDAQGSPVES